MEVERNICVLSVTDLSVYSSFLLIFDKNDKLLHLPTAEVYLEVYDTRHGGVDVVFVGPRKGWKSLHCFGSVVFLNTAILHTVRITVTQNFSSPFLDTTMWTLLFVRQA